MMLLKMLCLGSRIAVNFHLFNPENDLALADGGTNYCPPPAAMSIASDLATLPLWFAPCDDVVFLPNKASIEFYESMSYLFKIATPFAPDTIADVDRCVPWGWSPQVKRRFKAMGFAENILPTDEDISNLRELSNRRTAISVLQILEEWGMDTPDTPVYFTSPDDVAAFVESMPRSVVKAPWSGSGKGVMWGLGRVEVPLENFYKGVIKRQGGVVCERFLHSVQEFAMEFHAADGAVRFVGYSLFKSEKGGYSGNLLAPDAELELTLSRLIPLEIIRSVREHISGVLSSLLRTSGYNGYLGVDMMIYRDADGNIRLNPCMEINMRMNMGVAARIIYDRHVFPGKRGHFFVKFHKKQGDALDEHTYNTGKYPVVCKNGLVLSGYQPLSPVSFESRYTAYMIIDE